MSGKGGGGSGKGNNGISGIPAPARNIVQSLKEIVSNFPEYEIYAALQECNMNPDEAVSRLLSQDPFHEVKSKREKKKESKDTLEPRQRGANIASNRGGRVNIERFSSHGGISHFSNNDQKKPLFRKENGSNASWGSLASAPATGVSNATRQAAAQSDLPSSGEKISTVGMGEEISSALQPSGMQSPWVGVPGQVSMADIVKMGKPQNKASHNIYDTNHSLRGYGSKGVETHTEGSTAGRHVPQFDEWPAIEHQPTMTVSSAIDSHVESEGYADMSNFNDANQYRKTHLEEELAEEDDIIEIPNANHVGHSTSAKNIPADDDASGAPHLDDNLYQDVDSYHHQRHIFENHEDEDGVSSMDANLEQLSLQKDDEGSESEEDNPSVIIPNHLQLHSPDCLNLSFGSFGTGANSAFSSMSPFTSLSVKNTLEETSTAPDVSSMGHSDARNPDYNDEEHLATSLDESLLHRTAHAVGSYEPPPVPQPEVLQQETSEIAQGNQYSFPSSPGFRYESSHHGEAAFPHSQTSTQMQNLAPFSNVMQAYANSLPGALLASTVQMAREDIPYSPFPVTKSMPAKYANNASLISGPALSMTETLGSSSVSAPQPTAQTLPGASVATGPSLPQHLAVHPYSQPTLPLGPFTNMIGYPFLPQNYTYMPSTFQQAFAGNSTYHQSLAAVLPQFKSSVSLNSLPQSATVGSGYGFGSSNSIPGGNFQLNPPTAPTGTTVGYDDVISSQYKDSNHMISLQQNENSPMWVTGPGSRTMSALPANTYYSFQGQNQQPTGFRQGQQPSQHLGPFNFPNVYHSQTGISLDLQQQNAREMSLGGSQGQPAKQSQQLWQNSY